MFLRLAINHLIISLLCFMPIGYILDAMKEFIMGILKTGSRRSLQALTAFSTLPHYHFSMPSQRLIEMNNESQGNVML